MATQNTITVGVNVTDNGTTGKRISDAKQLKKAYDDAATSAAKLGGTAGSRKFAAAGYSPSSGATMSEQTYGNLRGAAGATGASARDFANQAQGLGGLVRLYATWAANIYAVGAAFSALREAASVTNMIEGMNQLGVASGVALGSMAKRFADASGGAISLQEAMSATVKATSSGLSQKQFQQLGDVASKASRALGINMSDAVSRLTRGITKLEPELLDELGLFTKVGAASEEYAKKLGKSVTSLTDFEKRQAFANAVLKEGTDKFGNIDVPANPYDKLAASLKNLVQSGLELVNKVLGPLINVLSSSPTALATVMASLGLMLVRQAIPAIGQYKSALSESAEFAEKRWKARSEVLKKIELDSYKYMTDLTEKQADKQVEAYDRATKRIEQARSKGATVGLTSKAQTILSTTDYRSIGKEDIKYLKDLSSIEKKSGNLELAKSYREGANALRQWIAAEEQHAAMLQKIHALVQQSKADASILSPMGMARDRAEEARQSKARFGLLSKAAEDVSTLGMGGAWGALKEGVKAEKLTGLTSIFTKVAGAVTIAGTALIGFITAISAIIGWIGVAVGVFTTLYSILSTNAAATEKLNSAIDAAKDNLATATATFDKFRGVLSAQALEATSNAMAGLANSTEDVITTFLKFDRASGAVDKAWESLKGLIGFSKQDAAATAVAGNIVSMLQQMGDPALRNQLETTLRSTLNVTDLGMVPLQKALANIDPKTFEKLKPVLEVIEARSAATAGNIRAVVDSFKEVDTAYTGLSNSLKTTGPEQSFIDAVAKQAKTLADAIKDPQAAVVTFNEVLKDSSRLAGFPPSVQAELSSRARQYTELAEEAKKYKDEQAKLREELNRRLATFGGNVKTEAEAVAGFMSGKRGGAYAAAGRVIQADINVDKINSKMKELGKDFGNLIVGNLDSAIAMAMRKTGAAAAQANIDTQKSLASYLPKTVESIELGAKLELQSIEIRKAEITALYELSKQLKISVIEGKILDLEKQKREATDMETRRGFNLSIETLQKEKALYSDPNIARNIKLGKTKGTIDSFGKYEGVDKSVIFEQLRAQQGYSEQMATMLGKEKDVKIKETVDKYVQKFNDRLATTTSDLRKEDDARAEYIKSYEYLSKTSAEQYADDMAYADKTRSLREQIYTADARRVLETNKFITENFGKTAVGGVAAKQLQDITQIDPLTGLPTIRKGLVTQAAEKAGEFNSAENQKRLDQARANREKQLGIKVAEKQREIEVSAEKVALSREATVTSIETSNQLLEIELSKQGFITEAQATQQKSAALQLINTRELVAVEAERAKIAKLQAEYDLKKESGTLTGDELTRLGKQLSDEKMLSAARISNINLQSDGQRKAAEATEYLSTRQKGYADIFNNTFQSMADAIAEFAKTGKFNFKDMVSGMLQDILRLELRMQAMQMWQATKPGIMGFLGNIIPGLGGPGAGGTSVGAVSGNMYANYTQAKGGAWDNGVQAFAKGGTFTNSIVNSPTLFKFAKGTGLMGEAGPEAIMPLTRDNNGNLGVRAQQNQGNVEVVVNNFSNAQAQTKETQDSRGNRRIEVVIGEAAAGEMSRPGSSAQGAMRSTYGMTPQLIRR